MKVKLLVVDVGNTSTAVGLWRDGKVSRVAHIDGSVDDVAAYVSTLNPQPSTLNPQPSTLNPQLSTLNSCSAVAYASVVPKKDAKFRALFRGMGLRVVAVNSETFAAYGAGSGLKIDYPKPQEIGADRFSDAAGAFERYGAPTLIMDFGTALTAAVVTRDRVWRGGVIAPGFPLMRDYLFERTAKLPRMKLGGRLPKIGRTTEEAMRFGALVGYRGMVREIVAELKRNFKEDFRLVATGGFARWALKDAGLDFTVDPDLTLYGTGLICSKSL